MKKTILSVLLAVVGVFAMAQEPYFRAAWISTVANIDFPHVDAVGDYERQKADMIATLDELAAMHINTVVFQVRPTADALYKSSFEPWSVWLSGKQGEVPTYDPLELVCAEAHKRGIDVHVWVNPYRVTLATMNIEDISPDHLYYKHPEWFVKYGKQWYYAPHLQETRDLLCNVVAELVTNYDIEAIHMDDYFYPYPLKEAFPDSTAFAKDPRGFTDLGDWRRDNVNMAIEQVHNTIMSIKPEVQFGISPFGIWRNKCNDVRGSETMGGLQNYDDLYADILLWMEKGWIDYVVPQLYWEIGKKVADYEILAHWWAQYATDKCRVYIGMAPYQLGNQTGAAAWREGNEICRQLRLNRTIPGITGECYFRTCDLLENRGNLADSLKQVFYPSYVPAPRK